MIRRVRIERHAEWLLDESIRETFPASDPIAAAQPGSIVSHAYARRGARQRDSGPAVAEAVAWALGTIAVGLVLRRLLRPGKRRRH